MRKNIYALHGFLGQPSDWDIIPEVSPIDIFNMPDVGPSHGLWGWAKKFNTTIKTMDNILIGYSMGGRLALHALIDNPEKWKAAILISAHPGLNTQAEKESRIQKDLQWAKLFAKEPWATLMHAWNEQDVFAFCNTKFNRNETHFNRKILSDVLIEWSLGKQDELSSSIVKLPMPIMWIAGEKDERYKDLSLMLRFSHPKSRVWIAPNAGHRVPWDLTQQFHTQIMTFLNETEELL